MTTECCSHLSFLADTREFWGTTLLKIISALLKMTEVNWPLIMAYILPIAFHLSYKQRSKPERKRRNAQNLRDMELFVIAT